jgi:hypothetical protein
VKDVEEPVEIGSISREIYVSAIDLAALLKITDNEVSRLSRSGVLTRVPHPEDSCAFLYPLLENVTRYVTHLRSAREKAHVNFLVEKSRLQKIQRVRAERQHATESGVLIEKEKVFATVGAGILAYKQALLSRGERLEATLGQIPDREARVQAIRGDDMRPLGILAAGLEAINSDGG